MEEDNITIEHISTITVSKLQSTDKFNASEFNPEEFNKGNFPPGTFNAVWSLGIMCVVFHPTILLLATGCRDKNVKLWLVTPRDEHTPGDESQFKIEHVSSLTGHAGFVNTVAFNHDGTLLATGSSDGTVKLWRLSLHNFSAENVATLNMKSDSRYSDYCIRSVVFHPKIPLLATGDSDGTVKLWNIDNPLEPICLATNKQHSNWVMSVAFHPTAPFLATGSADRTAMVWYYRLTPESQEPLLWNVLTLSGHSEGVCSIVFQPNVEQQKQPTDINVLLLATGSADGTAKFWEITDLYTPHLKGTCLATTEKVISNKGNIININSVAFDPLAKAYILATGSNILKLCELSHEADADNDADTVIQTTCTSIEKKSQNTDTVTVEYKINSSSVQSVAFHPTAPLLATGLTNGFVEIYRVIHPSGTILTTATQMHEHSANGGKSHTRRTRHRTPSRHRRTHTRRRSRKQQQRSRRSRGRR